MKKRKPNKIGEPGATWSCSVCTLENLICLRECAVCGAASPIIRRSSRKSYRHCVTCGLWPWDPDLRPNGVTNVVLLCTCPGKTNKKKDGGKNKEANESSQTPKQAGGSNAGGG